MTMIQLTIAARSFTIEGEPLAEAVKRMPGFHQFKAAAGDAAAFRIIYADMSAAPADVEQQYDFEADGVSSVFSAVPGGYHLRMVRHDGAQLVLWSVQHEDTVYISGSLAPQMLRFALWIAYGVMSVNHRRIPVHGSCIVNGGRAYLFLGESGTGKSTHTRLWRENIEGSRLLNDDSPIISAEPEGVFIYGSPWSGKTPCYVQERYPLAACVRLSQAPRNEIKKLKFLHAYAALHPSCPPEFAYDDKLYDGISETLDALLSTTGVYHLDCLPDAAAARLSYETLSRQL